MPNQMIALQARAPEIPSYNELIAGRDANMARRNALALQQQTMQQNAMMQQRAADAESASRGALRLAHGGDFAGAESQFGLGAGNMDVHKLLAGLQTEQRDQLHTKLASIVPAATAALNTADPAQRAAIFQAAAPQLVQSGWTQEQIASFPLTDDALTSAIENARDPAQAMAAFAKSREAYTLAPNQERRVGSTVIARNEAPEGLQYIQLADGTWQAVPKTAAGGATPGVPGTPRGNVPSGAALTVDVLRPVFVAQESGGDYTAVSPKGAMGAYQVMPPTAQTLAKRLGLPWRPDLMTSASAEGKQYQDAVGGAALQEAIGAGGGDLATIAKYYHGGSNRNMWGPKTNQYAREIEGRLGGGGAASPTSGQPFGPKTPPKPAKVGASTEGERRFGTVAQNMMGALDDLVGVLKSDPGAIQPGTGEYLAGLVPFYGAEAKQWVQSEGRQQFDASILAALDAITYINTGAGTSKAQEDNYRRSYVPTAQDTSASAQKKLDRLVRFVANIRPAAGVMWTPEMDAKVKALREAVAGLARRTPAASASRASSGVRVTKVAD